MPYTARLDRDVGGRAREPRPRLFTVPQVTCQGKGVLNGIKPAILKGPPRVPLTRLHSVGSLLLP
jgi:hypothetical protein